VLAFTEREGELLENFEQSYGMDCFCFKGPVLAAVLKTE
jgi:hypothetical protein